MTEARGSPAILRNPQLDVTFTMLLQTVVAPECSLSRVIVRSWSAHTVGRLIMFAKHDVIANSR